MSKVIKVTPLHRGINRRLAIGYFGLSALAGSAASSMGPTAFAEALYWDSGIPGHSRKPLLPKPTNELSDPIFEDEMSSIDDASERIDANSQERKPASAEVGRSSRLEESEGSRQQVPVRSADSMDSLRSFDLTGITLGNQVIEASKANTTDDEYGNHTKSSAEPKIVRSVTYDHTAFRSDPVYQDEAYDAAAQVLIYGGKTKVATQRPIPEIGRPFYDVGSLSPGINLLGRKNLVFGHLYGFGDWRTAVAFNDNGGNELAQIATRLNLDIDLGLTATERLHALFQPLQKDGAFTRCELAGDDDDQDCKLEIDLEPQTLFFEGDLAAITAGITDDYPGQDLPITFGLVPLLFQNGIWVEDAFLGGAMSVPAMNSRMLDISNADVTVFAGFDDVEANGVVDASGKVAKSNVNLYGIATFIEALEGYIEAGYGYVDAEDSLSDQDYHSATVALTRRYGGKISNSLRLVGSFGQDRDQGDDQNGLMILIENSLITSKPYHLVPYANAFVGIDRPVPLARQNGLLKNTGINFESDALTGFPFLDDTGQNAYGGAFGLEYLFDLDQQIVLEAAVVRELADISSSSFESIVENQYAIGTRYQKPLNEAWLLRADAMYGWRESESNIAGVRTELRFKF